MSSSEVLQHFDDEVRNAEGTLQRLSLEVLSIVENRVRNAFMGASPAIDIPTENSNINTRPNFNLGRKQKSTDAELSSTPVLSTANNELPTYTLQEVSFHESRNDCWVIIYDRIYDITSFVFEHPGGEDVLLEYAGRDCTLPFRSVGHSKLAQGALEPYLIGILTENERLWSKMFDLRVARS